jgi:excinuclease ABC subunit A
MISDKELDKLDPKEYILIKGARVHNLRSINVAIQRKKLVVITGLSGSGKSSLAFDTLYSEGQRRYVESLSSYARQFLGRMNKPEVDYIKGISPAIAIEQKVNTRNPRSTVGTSTEIYDYMKLLYARIGKTFSPISGNLVKRHSVTDVVDYVMQLPAQSKVMFFAPVEIEPGRTPSQHLNILMQQGFTRILINNQVARIEEILPRVDAMVNGHKPAIVIDRFSVDQDDDELMARIADSAQTAFYEGRGECWMEYETPSGSGKEYFSNRFEADGITFEEPSVNLFAFNNPYGACKRCEGFGSIIGIDDDLVIPNKSLSVYEDAIVCWKGEKMSEWKDHLVNVAYKFEFPIHKPIYHLTPAQVKLLWEGNRYFEGINAFFKMVEENTYKIQYRVMLSRYRGKTICPDCMGTRLRKDANYVKIAGRSISELVLMPLSDLHDHFQTLQLDAHDSEVGRRLLLEINNRLEFLNDVGLGYLTLNRLSSTLSGGESQRINLATSLGSSLVGSLYILDEPSIGLHQRDTHRLIKVLKRLRDLGNTVIVVEHDEDIMHMADQIIDIGPMAGSQGGQVLYQGNYEGLIKHDSSFTSKYLSGKMKIPLPPRRRKWKEFIQLEGVRQHNLKGFTVKIPLHVMTVITGVSGSGKSTLVKTILYPSLKKLFGGYGEKTGKFDKLSGDHNSIRDIEFVDQNPIGRSSRSNPVTYIKAYDEIRTLWSQNPLAKARGYSPGFFSFNIEGGRCPECEGEGKVKIEMQFMADISLVCETCNGTRFKEEILDIKYQGKAIHEILDLTVDEAMDFFENSTEKPAVGKRIAERLKPLQDVGLGYIKLGQSSSTLSGGEAQRIKLASFLTKGTTQGRTLFIFDEPTTGLHFHDIHVLLKAFEALLDNGHSIVIIEHNPEIIKSADWVIDLGPEGGDKGGNLVFAGTPEELVKCSESITGQYLRSKIED